MIDFHCHLDLFPDPTSVAARAEAAGVDVLSVTTTPKAWRKTASLADGRCHIRTALGLHPQLAHERSNELSLFEALIDETQYVGEIGLDGSPGYRRYADIQLRVFDRILSIAQERGGRILSIHSRRAADSVIAALRKHESANVAVLHWFSGTQKQLTEAKALGCWFSVGPAMMRSIKGRRLVEQMPRERVITETDGPFAQEDARPLEPSDVRGAIDQLGSIWRLDQRETDRVLQSNLQALVSLVPDTKLKV